MVFSKTYCPFCTRAKNALSQAGVGDMAVVELDERGELKGSLLREGLGAQRRDGAQRAHGVAAALSRPHALGILAARPSARRRRSRTRAMPRRHSPAALLLNLPTKRPQLGPLSPDDGSELQGQIKSKYNHHTVPAVFINGWVGRGPCCVLLLLAVIPSRTNLPSAPTAAGELLGGCDDTLAAIKSGKLKGMLDA